MEKLNIGDIPVQTVSFCCSFPRKDFNVPFSHTNSKAGFMYMN